jgi:hypothetical protein
MASENTVDVVFRRYGEVMFAAQALEQHVENLCWGMLKQRGEANRDARDELEGLSLGAIFKRVEHEIFEVDPLWSDNLKAFIRWRNYIAHLFFIDARGFQNDEEIGTQALQYLKKFERASATASFHLHLLSEGLGLSQSGRFSSSIEESLARSQGITQDTQIRFKRFKPNA